MADDTGVAARLEGAVREAWDGGGIVDLRLLAVRPIDGWVVEVDLGGEIVNLWNARVLAREGTRYTLGPMDYNTRVPAGTSTDIGAEIAGDAQVGAPQVSARLASEAASETAQGGAGGVLAPPDSPDGAAGEQAAAPPPAPATVPPPVSAAPPPLPVVPPPLPAPPTAAPTAGGTVPTVPPAATWGDDFAPGPLSVRGATIIDSAGDAAEIRGMNWFGFETDIFVAHGLWARNWRDIMNDVKELGFNTLRIPFSGALVDTGGAIPEGVDYTLNPDLEGLSGLQVLDAIVAYADRIGLRVLLDYHRGNPGSGPNDNGLWYGDGRTEADVIAEWREVAARYRDAPAVIGADLMNEPHMATWGDGSDTDWAAAAARIGNAILKIAPDWLIVVEGVAVYDGDTYWWGGNLMGAREHPVALDRKDKLVYSAHDYPASVHDQPWFDGRDLTQTFRDHWGYLVEEGIAPVLLGEWGSRLETAEDLAWADELSAYLGQHGIPWMWWALNPNSADTGGLFADDWTTVRPDVTRLLDPLIAEPQPAAPQRDGFLLGDEAVMFAGLSIVPPADDADARHGAAEVSAAHAGVAALWASGEGDGIAGTAGSAGAFDVALAGWKRDAAAAEPTAPRGRVLPVEAVARDAGAGHPARPPAMDSARDGSELRAAALLVPQGLAADPDGLGGERGGVFSAREVSVAKLELPGRAQDDTAALAGRPSEGDSDSAAGLFTAGEPGADSALFAPALVLDSVTGLDALVDALAGGPTGEAVPTLPAGELPYAFIEFLDALIDAATGAQNSAPAGAEGAVTALDGIDLGGLGSDGEIVLKALLEIASAALIVH